MSEPKCILTKEWNDELASYRYVLKKFIRDTTSLYFGKPIDTSYWHVVASGNKAWADRTAKHYKIEIE